MDVQAIGELGTHCTRGCAGSCEKPNATQGADATSLTFQQRS